MAKADGAFQSSVGPSPVRVLNRGVPGRLAAAVVVGTFAIVVGIGFLGRGDDRPPVSHGALGEPSPTTVRTPLDPPATADEVLPQRSCTESLPTGGTPLPDIAEALPRDDGNGPLPLGAIDSPPNADRLDFLFEGGGLDGECFRDAHWMDPLNSTMGSGVWTAGRPFHVREGFINNGPNALGNGFDVVLYVTRMETGRNEPTYRYTSDYVLRGASARCGPTYQTQGRPETCEWFVHDFPDGLPEGRFAIWAVWEAPCWAWVDLGLAESCSDPDAVIPLFASGFDAPYRQAEPEYIETVPAR
ncbi:MAG TPA: hypothetical protein VLS28_05515 [Candidatus Sulfomarinibacteraceae bacterium]|nr:hypothetical protein [Candidatus Sulfomarinibacteraceae bacterium]